MRGRGWARAQHQDPPQGWFRGIELDEIVALDASKPPLWRVLMLGTRPPAASHAGSVEIFPDDPVRPAPSRVDGVLLRTLTAVLREVGEASAGLVPVVLSAAGQEEADDDDRDGGAFHLTPPSLRPQSLPQLTRGAPRVGACGRRGWPRRPRRLRTQI